MIEFRWIQVSVRDWNMFTVWGVSMVSKKRKKTGRQFEATESVTITERGMLKSQRKKQRRCRKTYDAARWSERIRHCAEWKCRTDWKSSILLVTQFPLRLSHFTDFLTLDNFIGGFLFLFFVRTTDIYVPILLAHWPSSWVAHIVVTISMTRTFIYHLIADNTYGGSVTCFQRHSIFKMMRCGNVPIGAHFYIVQLD